MDGVSMDVGLTADVRGSVTGPQLVSGPRLDGEQPTWNCYGPGESNCLIETKLRVPVGTWLISRSDFCPVL